MNTDKPQSSGEGRATFHVETNIYIYIIYI